MANRKNVKVLITEVNLNINPPLARARELVNGAAITISLNIGRNTTMPEVGQVWWVQSLGTRWALYGLVSNSTNVDTNDQVSSTTVELFFQVREQATKLSYFPVVKFNAAKVSGDPKNVANYIISWTKCNKKGDPIRNEKAQQYTWNPNESTDGTDLFVDPAPTETYNYSVEIPFEIDNPKTSYYKARVRAVSKANATKGAWSEWTKPKLPLRNSLNGPPQVEDVELNFEVKETTAGKLDYRAIVNFKDVGYWDIPGYDFEDDVSYYEIQLQPLKKKIITQGTLNQSLTKLATDHFYVKEIDKTGLPTSLSTAFDVQIGNEIIGISSRTGDDSNRKYNIAQRGKYSTIAAFHADNSAVKQYNIDDYDNYDNLIEVDPDLIPKSRAFISDKDQDDTTDSWPKLGRLGAFSLTVKEIKAGQTNLIIKQVNTELLKNLPTAFSPFFNSEYLFKIIIKNEIIGVKEWSFNNTTKVLHLSEVERGIDNTQSDDYNINAKVRIDSWLPVGYLQNDISEESDTILIVEDRFLNITDDNFTIKINQEKLQVYSRRLYDTFQYDNRTYYIYEYEVYRAIQNTDTDSHIGGTDTPVFLDLGYYYAATFEDIPQPNKLYWKARVRARDRFSRLGIWSDWTDPQNAAQDADILAPAPRGVALNFNRKHRNRGWSVSALVSWDKVTYEIPGGDTVDDVKGYQSRLLSSDGSKLVEEIGYITHTVTSRYLTDNIAYLVLDSTNLNEYSFSPGQLFTVDITTVDNTELDTVYNGSHRILDFNLSTHTIAFYKENNNNNLDLEDTTGSVVTGQTVIKVYEPEKTNSTQRQLGTDGAGYIFLTSHDLSDDVSPAEATNKDYYEMMYVKDSWKSLTGDYYEYFVARGVMGTKIRKFKTQWMMDDITEPIKPMLVFTYPAAFEATKLVDVNAQELEPFGGARYSQTFSPVRRQYWYLGQVRTLDVYNRVGEWSIPSSPATALDNVRPPQPFNINVIPFTNYVKVDWDIQPEPGVFLPTYIQDQNGNGELNPDDFEIISSDVSYFKVQLWSEDPHAEAPDQQEAFGLNGNPTYASGIVTLTTDQAHTFTVGESVIIKGCWPTSINGEHVIKTVPSALQFTIQVDLSAFIRAPYQIDGMVFKKGEAQALDLYKQYPIHFFRRSKLIDLTKIILAEKNDVCQVIDDGDNNGYYKLINPNFRLLSNWHKIPQKKVQIPGLVFYDRYVNLTSRNVATKTLPSKVWARICSVDEAGNQSEWIAAGPFSTDFVPGPSWVLTRLIHQDTSQLDAKVQWAEVTSSEFTVGSYNIELQGGRLYAQLYNDNMDFWGLDPTQDVVFGMLSAAITDSPDDTTLNVTEFGDSADVGEYLKIGDELMRVESREATDDINGFIDAVYTVTRGVVNTTPASHSNGALMLKVQSEAIIVRELFTPAAPASLTANETYDIIIGNEKMTVLDRVTYGSNTYGSTLTNTSPTYDPSNDWVSAGSISIGTIGSGSSSQHGSSALLFSIVKKPTTTEEVWIAATSTGIWTSSDLTSWTQTNDTANLRAVAYGNGIWVAVGDGGTILTSLDPTDIWTLSNQTPFATSNIYSVKYGNGTWVVAGENNKIAATYNPNSTWTIIDPNIDFLVDVFNRSVTSNVAKLLIASNSNLNVGSVITVSSLGDPFSGENTITAISPSLITGFDEISFNVTANDIAELTLTGDPTTSVGLISYALNINSITFGAGYWAAACDEGVVATTSNPFGTWTKVTTGTTNKLNAITYANGYWVTVGDNTTILTGVNPQSWVQKTTPTDLISNFHDAAYGAGKWVLVGSDGNILVTSNLNNPIVSDPPNPTTDWIRPSGAVHRLFAVAFGTSTTTSQWLIAGGNDQWLIPSTTSRDSLINAGNLYVYLVLRDRNWGSNLGQIEDFIHPDLTPIFDSLDSKTATRTGAVQADRDNNDFWDYTFTDVAPTLYYRSRVQGVLKSGVPGNWSHYTLWANPNDLIPPQTPFVNADFDAKVLEVSWFMPDSTVNQVFKVDNFDEVIDLTNAQIGDIAVYSVTTNGVTTVYAYRLTALPSNVSSNWIQTLSPIDDQGNTIDISNDYLYKDNAAAFYQVQVSRIPKKWEAAGSLGRTLKLIGDNSTTQTIPIDPGQKLDAYPKIGAKLKIGPGPSAVMGTIKNGLNEVQQLRLFHEPSGTIRLTFRGYTTPATEPNAITVDPTPPNSTIPYSNLASQIQTALNNLTSIASKGSVTVTRVAPRTWNIAFKGGLATQTTIPQMTVDISNLTPNASFGGNEMVTLTAPELPHVFPATALDWQKPIVYIGIDRPDSGNYSHSPGALVQWMKQDGTDFYDPKKPFSYKWLWKDDRFITEMSRSYVVDSIKNYLYIVRVRAGDAAGNFSAWDTQFVSPTGVPTPDVESLEFTDIDNTPDTLEAILTFIGSMDVSENIDTFVTELMPAQQMRLLNPLTATGLKVFIKRLNKVLDPAVVGAYPAYIEDEIVWVTHRYEATYQGVPAYRLAVTRGYSGTDAVAHDKGTWFQWFHHFSVKDIIEGTAYTPSLDANVDADSGTVISATPPATGRYKTIFHGIKAGRWYKGRAKAVTSDGKSSAWSDWSNELRGENGASTGGDPVPNPNPVRNLILDVDTTKANVSWLAPIPTDNGSASIQSIAISEINLNGTTATVTTATPHGFSMGDAGTDSGPDTVTISGATAPFNGTFEITSIPTQGGDYNFTITVDTTDNSPSQYPIPSGSQSTAVVTLASSSSADNTDIDHYEVWYSKGKYNGTTLLTTILKLNIGAGNTVNGVTGVAFPQPYIYTNLNVPSGSTVLTFNLPQSPGNYKYFIKVVAVNGAGKKSEPRYAAGDVVHPPKPTVGPIQILSIKGTKRCKAFVQILQPPPVADMDKIAHYDLQWVRSKLPNVPGSTLPIVPPSNPFGIHVKHPSKEIANDSTKHAIITGDGGLPRNWYLFVRLRAVNKDGTKSNWTLWKRKKIVTATQ